MRLNALIFALYICVYHTRAASISAPEKKLDDLDNVDLDNVAIEPEILDQDTIAKEIENNVVKRIEDIPVKIIEEPILDENSNDYVPSEDISVNVKRVDIDLKNPGPPQRQEHETQNPENYGENEKALFAIKQTINNAQTIFDKGLLGVSDSFKTFLTPSEDLPTIQKNIKNLEESFTDQIRQINETIRTYLKPDVPPVKEESEKKSNLYVIDSRLELLEKNFNAGLNLLSEGVEIYSIMKEEDEAEKAIAGKSDFKAESDVDNGSASSASPTQVASEKPTEIASPVKPPTSNPTLIPSLPSNGIPANPWNTLMANMQNSISNTMSSLNVAVSNIFNGNNNPQSPTPTQGSNPIVNFIQNFGLSNILQGQTPASQAPPIQGQQASKPSEVQADTPASTPASTSQPAQTPIPWGPQAFFQQVQTSISNLLNLNPNNQPVQVTQPTQITAGNGPILQGIQNVFSIIRPGQSTPTAAIPQPSNVVPVSPSITQTPEKPAETPASKPQDAIPVQGNNVLPEPNRLSQLPQQTQQINAPVPAQAGPIQQLVQNNPIIKGIQNAVQRLQGTPNPETPREEIITNENSQNGPNTKGHYGSSPPNSQGDNNDSSGIDEKTEEDKIEIIPPISDEEIAEIQIQPEELKAPSVSDKTE